MSRIDVTTPTVTAQQIEAGLTRGRQERSLAAHALIARVLHSLRAALVAPAAIATPTEAGAAAAH